jgi:hypothetical protein
MAAACLPAWPRTAELSLILDAIALTNGTTSTDRPLRGTIRSRTACLVTGPPTTLSSFLPAVPLATWLACSGLSREADQTGRVRLECLVCVLQPLRRRVILTENRSEPTMSLVTAVHKHRGATDGQTVS